jgi:hypothetical protein
MITGAALQEKNVGTDVLEGKVGRIYMPKQDVDNIALRKMKVRGVAGRAAREQEATRFCSSAWLEASSRRADKGFNV